MPTYRIYSEASGTKPFFEETQVCFAALAGQYAPVPNRIELELTFGERPILTFGYSSELETDRFKTLVEIFPELGFGQWMEGVEVTWKENPYEYNCRRLGRKVRSRGVVSFDASVPVPIAVSMASVVRLPGEGRGRALLEAIKQGFCPRIGLIADEILRYREELGLYTCSITFDHTVIDIGNSGLRGAQYFMNWEKRRKLTGGMKQHPRYEGRSGLMNGGNDRGEYPLHTILGYRRSEEVQPEQLTQVFKAIEKAVKQ